MAAKILHFNIFKTIPKGVLNQLRDEQEVVELERGHFQWDIKVFSQDQAKYRFQETVVSTRQWGVCKAIANYISLRKTAYGWLRDNSGDYDAILLRYRSGDILEYLSTKGFGKYFTVHHTMEVPEAKSRKFPFGVLEAGLDSYLGPRIISNAVGIIGMTPEIINYELSRLRSPKPAYCHPNGVDLRHYKVIPDLRKGVPKLLLVASIPAPWHGVDLLIDELSRADEKFELHLVGNFSKHFEKQYEKEREDSRIIYHGFRENDYIEALAAKCDVGLSCFALFRKNMREACPLKVRQYLAMGLPVYSGHIDSGLPADFPYYCNGGLNASALFDFVRLSRSFSREEVRASSSNHIDKKIQINRLVEWIDSVIQTT